MKKKILTGIVIIVSTIILVFVGIYYGWDFFWGWVFNPDNLK